MIERRSIRLALLAVGALSCTVPACVQERALPTRLSTDVPDRVEPASGLDAMAILKRPGGFQYRALTDLSVTRGDRVSRLHDERTVRRAGGGDFAITIRRQYEGADTGESIETFDAVWTARRYFTKGSGGSFVRWDDARNEPAEALVEALSDPSVWLVRLLPCIGAGSPGESRTFVRREDGCRATFSTGLRGAEVEVDALSGDIAWDGDRFHAMNLGFEGTIATGAGPSGVRVQFEARLSDLPDGTGILPPTEFVESRRDRPVRMVQSVLGGLVESWGPGAPPMLNGR